MTVTLQAGGVANLVAKKSSTGGFTYSEATQITFLHDCSENANELVCQCVLNQLQKQYSEKEYKKLDANLQKGIEENQFTSFISNAVNICDAEFGNTSTNISEESAKKYVDSLLKNIDKKEYVSNCASNLSSSVGGSAAKKTCKCMLNKVTHNPTLLINTVMEKGSLTDNYLWAIDIAFDCMPDKMTPEIKKHFSEQMNQMGIPKSISKCTIEAINKEYSFRTLLKASLEDGETINKIFIMMVTKCSLEYETK